MKALFLAAGFSTRLKPLTDTVPKGLLPIANRPLVSHLLDQVVPLPSIDQVALITNALAFSPYQEFLSQEKYRQVTLLNNQVTQDQDRLGAIGDLQLALDSLGWDDDVLVLPSDTLVSLAFPELLAFFSNHRSFVNVVKNYHDIELIRNKLGCAAVENDRIVSFEEKPSEPKSQLVSVPIYIYAKDTLQLISQYIQAGQNTDSPGAIIPWLLTQTPCYAYEIKDGYYYDVGTVEMYERINQDPEQYLIKH